MDQERVKRKPGRPRASESPSTMTQILRTASFLFMEHGYEKVSLESVAQACGLTKASVYYYFSNKSVLFTEALLFVLKMAYEQTASVIVGPGTLKERLQEVARRHMRNQHVDFETMMREAQAELTEEQILKVRDREADIHRLLARLFAEAMDNGEMKRSDPLLLSHAFVAMMTVRNRAEIVNDVRTAGQAAEEIVQLIWAGIAPPES
ncbi:TetR/AcrR family transcriptional regulator [Paenibacillus sp. strain BS8-2]